MPLITCKQIYGPTTTDGAFNPSASYTGVAFNTDTRQMEPIAGTWRGALLEPKPANIYFETGAFIWAYCADAPATHGTVYRFNRFQDGYTSGTEFELDFCGYVAPDTTTCNVEVIDVIVTEENALVVVDNAIGPLEYSLNGGSTRQDNPNFRNLSAGQYEITVFDLGATRTGCKYSVGFTVPDFAATTPAPRLAQLATFQFSGNPAIVEVISTRRQRDVLVEVYVETAHHSGTFTRAYVSRRRTDSEGRARLDVSDVLAGQLQPELHTTPGWHRLTSPIRNWFVRTADVSATTGRPGTWRTSNNSVVLLGGLPPEPLQAGLDYFTTAMRKQPFMSWQPNVKQVGSQHLEVLQLLINELVPLSVVMQPYSQRGQALDQEVASFPIPALPAAAPNSVPPPPVTADQTVHLAQLVIDIYNYGDAGSILFTTDDTYQVAGRLRLEIDRSNSEEPRQLIYQNSLGGFDTVAMFGKMITKLPAERSTVEVYQPLSATATATSQERSYNSTGLATVHQLSTGLTSNRWLEYLQELVTPGRQVFDLVAGRPRPIIITTKELSPYEDDQGHVAAVIEYKSATKTNYFADYERNTNRSRAIGAAWR